MLYWILIVLLVGIAADVVGVGAVAAGDGGLLLLVLCGLAVALLWSLARYRRGH